MSKLKRLLKALVIAVSSVSVLFCIISTGFIIPREPIWVFLAGGGFWLIVLITVTLFFFVED